MSQIDDLLTDFRSHVPAAPIEAAKKSAASAVVGSARRLRLSRAVTASIGVVGVGGLAAILAFLLIQAPTPQPTSDDTGTARAAWGMTATVSFDGSPGTTPSELSVRRVIDALTTRARQRDIRGFRVLQAAPGQLTLRVPAATTVSELEDLTRLQAVEVFNLSSSLIAQGSHLRDLASAAATLPGPARRFAVQSNRAGFGVIEVVSTRTAAEQRLREAKTAGTIIPLPADVLLVDRQSARDPIVLLVRDEPVLGRDVWSRASFVESRFELDAYDEALPTMTGVVKGLGTSVTVSVITRQGPGRGYEYGFTDQIETTGRGLALDGFDANSDDHAVFGIGEPLSPYRLTVETSAPYGEAPPPAGDRSTPPPAALAKPDLQITEFGESPTDQPRDFLIEPGSLVRPISVTLGQRTWTVWAARTTTGREAAWTHGGADDLQFGTANCPVGMGVPILRSCGQLGIGKEYLLYGRARTDEFATVEGVFADGTVVPGAARNGWFMIPFRHASLAGPRITVVARDAAGQEIAQLTPFGSIVRP